MFRRMFVSAVIGAILGYAASKLLFLQWLTLIPWGLAALVIGYFSATRQESILAGLAYGFLLGFIFMLAGYSGADPVITKVPFFVLLGIISAVCGAILAFLGQVLRRLLIRNP